MRKAESELAALFEKARVLINEYTSAPDRSLVRRRAGKALAQHETALHAVYLELEQHDAAWREAHLAASLARHARIWYAAQGLPLPAFAQEHHEKDGGLFAA